MEQPVIVEDNSELELLLKARENQLKEMAKMIAELNEKVTEVNLLLFLLSKSFSFFKTPFNVDIDREL